jgi:hypothetical protein
MANDWFKFLGLAGSFTGTGCIFFVQVVFFGAPGAGAPGAAVPNIRDSAVVRRAAVGRAKGIAIFGDHDVTGIGLPS